MSVILDWLPINSDINGGGLITSVSTSANGEIVAIGTPYGSGSRGYARIYQNINNSWIQIGNKKINTLVGV